MGRHKLTDQEIKLQLQEGRNYKRLYVELKDKYDELKAENKQLRNENAELKRYFSAVVETQAARITELETMVYSRKKRPRSGGNTDKKPKTPRDPSSYRRDTPGDEEITSEHHHAVSGCRHCGGQLVDIIEYVRYVQDIILAALAQGNRFNTTERHVIQKGYRVPCGKYSSAADLRGQEVSLGPRIRTLVCYLITPRDHSYDQVIHILWDMYRFKITDGEISNILDGRRLALLPEYENLKVNIRAGPGVHMDESRWRIQSEGTGYAWSMSSTTSTDVVFKLAGSRGKGNAEELIGDNFQGVGITDRYSAYKHLFLLHQICWAHLQRTAQDLTHLECLSKTKKKHVAKFYQNLAEIYSAIRYNQAEPFDEASRAAKADALLEKVTGLCQPHPLDPKKLADLKAGILEYQDCLFICLAIDGIPSDNNRAERDIKQLVIKRRKSLGGKTPKGARTLEVLLSVCWSLYNRDRDNFFPNFHALAPQS